MSNAILLVLFCFVVLIWLSFNSLFVYLATKVLRIDGANYKTSFRIFFAASLFIFIWRMLFPFGDFFFFGSASLLNLVVFHLLLKRYYKTGFIKNLLVYAMSTVFMVVIFWAVIVPTRLFVFEPFYVVGDSMAPSFQNEDYFLVKKFDHSYNRGDVVIVSVGESQNYFVRRVIALPGEKVEIRDGEIFITDQKDPAGFKLVEDYLGNNTRNTHFSNATVMLGSDEYYLLADNQKTDSDSKSFGVIKKQSIIGKFWLKPLPFFKKLSTQ